MTDCRTAVMAVLRFAQPLTCLFLAFTPISVLSAGGIAGQVTNFSTQQPLAGATVEVYQSGSRLMVVSSGADGGYTLAGLSSGNYAVMCKAPGYEVYIQSAVTVIGDQTTTQNFPLPPLSTSAPLAKEYIYLGSRMIAIEGNLQQTVDFEQFTGWNWGTVGLPPLTVGLVTFSGGQVYPVTECLFADTTPLYGTFSRDAGPPPGWDCNGCLGTMTIDFAEPVSGLSFLLLNGAIRDVTYTVQDDLGGRLVRTLPANYDLGKETIVMPSAGIRQVTITSSAGNAWDFWVDNMSFTRGG